MEIFDVSPDVLSRELDGEAVLLDLKSGRYFGLNGTAARIWVLLKDGCSRGEITSRIAEDFDVDAARASADVDAFVSVLLDRSLIAVRNKATA